MADELEAVLSRYGYRGSIASLAVTGNKRIQAFIKLIVEELKSCDTLTGEAKENFEELTRLSKELSREDYWKVLKKRKDAKLKNQEKDEMETNELEERAQSLREQLHTLNHIHRQMSAHHDKCMEESEAAAKDLKLLQREHKESVQESEEANTKFNQALEDLKASMTKLIGLYSNQVVPQTRVDTPRLLLSTLSLDPYFKAEEEFMKSLSEYAKKQFLPGMSKMADLSDITDYGLKDEEQLAQHLSKEEYDKQSQQLKRLQTIYPLVQTQLICEEVNKSHFSAACKRTREEIEEIKSGRGLVNTDIESLSQRIQANEERVSALKQKILTYDTSLPPLIKAWASLKTSTVLHGDYDLKLQRQEYYLSKKDEVITQLKGQRSRQELVSMLLEAELRRHRDTHGLLEACHLQLERWKSEAIERQEHLKELEGKQKEERDNADDVCSSFFSQLLNISSEGHVTGHVTRGEIEEKFTELIEEKRRIESEEKRKEEELNKLIEKMQERLAQLESCVFEAGGERDTRSIRFLSKEYKESVDKLQSMLVTLEGKMKDILKENEEKQKLLRSSPLLAERRNLFVYFFTDPEKLTAVMASLTHRVDTLATAVELTDTQTND